MNDSRATRTWTVVGLVALVVTVGVYSRRWQRRAPETPMLSVDADVRDAVGEPAETVATPSPAAARIAMGKPVPVSWFETPASRHAELDRQLLSSRRRRALAQSVSVQ